MKKTFLSHHLALGNALISLTDLQSNNSLEKTGTVVRSRSRGHLQHLLSDLSIEFRAGVTEVRLHIDELFHLVKLTIHLKYTDFLTIVVIRSIKDLNSRVAASKLTAARDP
jgi:hypothetical protein